MALYFYDYNNKRDYKTKLIWETFWESDWKETRLADLKGGGVTNFLLYLLTKSERQTKYLAEENV